MMGLSPLLLQALNMIHAAGYLHGDIRRENIIVEEPSGQVWGW